MTTIPTVAVERSLLCGSVRTLAALDEVGRGALAGPVTVGAVLIGRDTGDAPAGVRDSKLLSAGARQRLVEPIRAWAAGCGLGHASAAEIDQVGIMAALRLAGLRALAELRCLPDIVMLDGTVDFLTGPAGGLAGQTVATGGVIPGGLVVTRAKADRDCASVAAASVLAKVARDALMTDLAGRFPAYEWERNKGYGTADHTAAIIRWGPCDEHRRSWRLPVSPSAAAVDNDEGGGRLAARRAEGAGA